MKSPKDDVSERPRGARLRACHIMHSLPLGLPLEDAERIVKEVIREAITPHDMTAIFAVHRHPHKQHFHILTSSDAPHIPVVLASMQAQQKWSDEVRSATISAIGYPPGSVTSMFKFLNDIEAQKVAEYLDDGSLIFFDPITDDDDRIREAIGEIMAVPSALEHGDDITALRAEYSDDPIARASYDRQAADLDTQLNRMVAAISKELQIQRIRLAEIRSEETVLPLLVDAFEHGEAFAGALLIALNGSDISASGEVRA